MHFGQITVAISEITAVSVMHLHNSHFVSHVG